MKESLGCLKNAKDILKKAPIEGNRYADVKFVQEACGTAYLAVIKAVDEFLQGKGLGKKELPKSVDGYKKALKKYLSTRDSILLREFKDLYDELHIAGYCGGFLHNVHVVKGVLKAVKVFIDKLDKK